MGNKSERKGLPIAENYSSNENKGKTNFHGHRTKMNEIGTGNDILQEKQKTIDWKKRGTPAIVLQCTTDNMQSIIRSFFFVCQSIRPHYKTITSGSSNT